MSILQYIYKNDIGIIYILDHKHIYLIYSINYYFPTIKIILYLYNNKTPSFLLNKCNIVRVLNKQIMNKYNDIDIFYTKKT